MKESTETVDIKKQIGELSRLKGEEFVEKFLDILYDADKGNLVDFEDARKAALQVKRISGKQSSLLKKK